MNGSCNSAFFSNIHVTDLSRLNRETESRVNMANLSCSRLDYRTVVEGHAATGVKSTIDLMYFLKIRLCNSLVMQQRWRLANKKDVL